MMKLSYGFKVIVESDFALFTRPEMKVERVSYDVPTPSALQGLLKSVYWKPSIRFVIDRIAVYNPIKFVNIRRNEVKEKVSVKKVLNQMKNSDNSPEIFTKECISQRAGMILKDVKYGIEFHFEMTGYKSDKDDESEKKHYNIMLRRLRNGQCFRQPCMGCREFSIKNIRLLDENETFDYNEISPELMGERDLGFMLYDMDFRDGGKPLNDDWDNPRFSDDANARYYRPIMVDGVIDVAKYREDIRC